MKFQNQQGFTLIEVAVVLFIVGLLLGGLIVPLSEQREINNRRDAEIQLQEIRDALLGFAQANGRLPCPASAASNGAEVVRLAPAASSPATTCQSSSGLVPYTILGFRGPLSYSPQQQLLDPWHQPVRYSLTNALRNPAVAPFTAAPWKYASTPITLVATATDQPANLQVCTTSICTTAIATQLVAVLWSTGDNRAISPDQTFNLLGGPNFIFHPPVFTPGSEFDDILVWISQPELIYALSKTR